MAVIAFHCLYKFHLLPHEFMSLPENEQAFIMAAIRVYIAEQKKAEKKAKSGKSAKGRR